MCKQSMARDERAAVGGLSLSPSPLSSLLSSLSSLSPPFSLCLSLHGAPPEHTNHSQSLYHSIPAPHNHHFFTASRNVPPYSLLHAPPVGRMNDPTLLAELTCGAIPARCTPKQDKQRNQVQRLRLSSATRTHPTSPHGARRQLCFHRAPCYSHAR